MTAANPGTGVDELLKVFHKYSRNDTVVLCNTHRSAYQCAEHAVALLLSLSHQIPLHHERMKKNNPSKEPNKLIREKRIGLLGYGPINQNVHRILKGFDPKIFVLRRNIEADIGVDQITTSELESFIESIDILMIAAPLIKETNGLIGYEELRLLGSEGMVVNVGRGEIIKQKALYTALSTNLIGGSY